MVDAEWVVVEYTVVVDATKDEVLGLHLLLFVVDRLT